VTSYGTTHIFNTPPLPPCSRNYGTSDVQARAKLLKNNGWQPLGEDVGKLRSSGNMKNPGLAECHTITDKMQVYLNMFSPLMIHWIGGHVHGGHIVKVDHVR
jgi:hypothetical protein